MLISSKLEKIYGDRLLKLVLYGSQARGDATEDSDSDTFDLRKLSDYDETIYITQQ